MLGGQCPKDENLAASRALIAGRERRVSWIENRFEDGLIITSLDGALNWGRISSIWPMTLGIACCAIEMMAVGASRFDTRRPVHPRYGPLRASRATLLAPN